MSSALCSKFDGMATKLDQLGIRISVEDKRKIERAAARDRRKTAEWCRLTLLDAAAGTQRPPDQLTQPELDALRAYRELDRVSPHAGDILFEIGNLVVRYGTPVLSQVQRMYDFLREAYDRPPPHGGESTEPRESNK